MNASDHHEIRQLFNKYLHMYASRDDHLTGFFSDDFSGFTGGGDFLVKKREEWIAITRQDFAQVKDSLTIELKDLAIQSLSDTIAVTTGFFNIHLPIEDHILSRETARLVLIFRKESPGWKISHSSISIPYHLVREGEVYPLQELVERNKALEFQVEERTAKLSAANGMLRKAVEDITELQRVSQDMLKTQQLESLGVLAGGLAHDFNNILSAILGNVSLARLQINDPVKVAQRLERAETAAVRAKDLTQQLLTFSKGGDPVKKVITVGSLLKEATDFAIHGSRVNCQFNLADDLWPVEADEGQLSQVVHNLVLNAVQAMANGGTIIVAAKNADFLPEGKNIVLISVGDTGTGIHQDYIQRIFEPYFTTKQQGSGLGLATCYSIIKKHGGNINVESKLGLGTTFHISLPAMAQIEETVPAVCFETAQGNGHILVMDDEEVIREIITESLEELGYQVECTEDGSAAIELYRRRQEEGTPFAGVIMDLTIPGGIGGKEAITSLIEINPKVKAVVSSGYASDPVMANFRDYGFSAVLCKPYHVKELSTVIEDLLKD